MGNSKKAGKKSESKISPSISNDQLGENTYGEFSQLKESESKRKGKSK